jgi:hypothetical protein
MSLTFLCLRCFRLSLMFSCEITSWVQVTFLSCFRRLLSYVAFTFCFLTFLLLPYLAFSVCFPILLSYFVFLSSFLISCFPHRLNPLPFNTLFPHIILSFFLHLEVLSFFFTLRSFFWKFYLACALPFGNSFLVLIASFC